MTYCPNCGTELKQGSQFCHVCGKPQLSKDIQEENTSKEVSQVSERQQEFAGKLIKCPNCGEPASPFQPICEYCGYVFRDTKVSDSVDRLVGKLQQIHSDYQAKVGTTEEAATLNDVYNAQLSKVIRDYVIPNNIEDIYEFMMLADSNLNSMDAANANLSVGAERAVYDAWESKLEQAHQKAKAMHSNSQYMEEIETFYQRSKKDTSKKRVQAASARILKTILQNILVAIGLILAVVSVIVDVTGGNASMIYLMAVIVLIFPAWFLGRENAKNEEMVAALIGGFGCIAIGVIGYSFRANGSMLELGGVIVVIVAGYQTLKRMGLLKPKE